MSAGSSWLLEDDCSSCTCLNRSGMGDYRCKGCRVKAKPAPPVEEEVEEKPAVTPARPAVMEPTTDIADSDDMMEPEQPTVTVTESAVPEQPEPKPEPQPEPKPEPQPEPQTEPEPQSEPKPEPQPELKPAPQPELKPAPQPEPEPEEEEEEIELLDDPEPVRPAVIAKPNPDNIVNGGGTNAASASSSGSFGVEATTPYGDGKVVCQASGGVANRGSIATVANYEDCYAGYVVACDS